MKEIIEITNDRAKIWMNGLINRGIIGGTNGKNNGGLDDWTNERMNEWTDNRVDK